MRTAIAKACKAAGVPLFSPHDLRHRRISLLTCAACPGRASASSSGSAASVTADTYTHVLVDEAEVDYGRLLAASAAPTKTPVERGY